MYATIHPLLTPAFILCVMVFAIASPLHKRLMHTRPVYALATYTWSPSSQTLADFHCGT